MEKTIEIQIVNSFTVEYSFCDGKSGKLTKNDIEHIKRSIKEGCDLGGLIRGKDEKHRGWWSIKSDTIQWEQRNWCWKLK